MNTTESLINSAVDAARECLERDGEVFPTAQVISRITGEISLVGLDMQNEASKNYSAGFIKGLAKKTRADLVVFVAESWTVSGEKADDFMKNRHLYPNVSDYPGKEECVIFSIEEHGAPLRVGQGKIVVRDGKKTFDEIVFLPADASHMGRFVGFLGKRVLN